jgi:integrase
MGWSSIRVFLYIVEKYPICMINYSLWSYVLSTGLRKNNLQ